MCNYCIIGHHLFHFAEMLNKEASEFERTSKKLTIKLLLEKFKVN